MRVNSINNINYNLNRPSFKHTAVPYPEFASAYEVIENPVETKILNAIDKLVDLFSPKVSKEAMDIKAGIDSIYTATPKKAAKQKLISVLA